MPSQIPSLKWIRIPLLVFVGLFLGCSLYGDLKNATEDIDLSWSIPDSHLKRKIGIALFKTRTPFRKEGFENLMQDVFSQTLMDESNSLWLIKPGEVNYVGFLEDLPVLPSGEIDGLAIARKGRLYGLNAVISGGVFDISGKKEKRGILWFKETKSFIHFRLAVAAYDMETGAKIFDENIEDDIEVDEMDLEMFVERKTIELAELEEAIRDAAEELGEIAAEKIDEMPWRGFVTSAGDQIRLSAGSNVGLKSGDTLDVYEAGRIIEGVAGERFVVPGRKIGQITITTVEADLSEAAPIPDLPIRVGNSVRVPG